MTEEKIGQLAVAFGFLVLTFWGWTRLRRRRQSGDKAADFYVVDGIDTSNAPAEGYVTVAHFALPVDAEMARLRLESEAIQCVIPDVPLGSRSLLVGPAIELKVRATDAAAATAILRDGSQ